MVLPAPFRQATADHARKIAELIAISSDGVATIEWAEEAENSVGLTPLDVGERNYAGEDGDYSYRNCIVAEQDGEVIGMMLAFAIGDSQDPGPAPPYDGSDVFAPYKYLEAPRTWYICGIALFPEHRGRGLGTRMLDIARQQAHEYGYDRLSLVAFEQNAGSVRLYQRQGFDVVKRAPVVPHPLIHYTGDALLMVAEV